MILTQSHLCPICKKARANNNHRKCSRILQRRRNDAEMDKMHKNQHEHERKQAAINASSVMYRRVRSLQYKDAI